MMITYIMMITLYINSEAQYKLPEVFYATDGENCEPDGFRLMVTAVGRYLTENSKNAQLFVTENF